MSWDWASLYLEGGYSLLHCAHGGYISLDYLDKETFGEIEFSPKKVVLVSGQEVHYWEGPRSCSYLNGIVWDGKSQAVLAHEVGHFVGATGDEVEAWYNAALLFGKELVLQEWDQVEVGLRAYRRADQLEGLKERILAL